MMKIMKDKWARNEKYLKQVFETRTDLNTIDWSDLVKLTFEYIYNIDYEDIDDDESLNLNNITIIDNGDYQGTLLYIIPFKTYQPAEYDYLMTYVWYGSCSGCDALREAQDYFETDCKLTEQQIKDFLKLAKDIICNTIKPYNNGWRETEDFREEDTK